MKLFRRHRDSRVLLEGTLPMPWILGACAALALVFVLAVVGFSALNKTSTCGVCHIIKPELTTYEQSPHYRAGVGCQKCHTKPGVFNYLIRNLQGVTNLIVYTAGTWEKPITTFVGSNNCEQCHPNSQIEKDLVVGNIRINHTGLRKAGYQCITCHADISHPGTQLEVARVSQNKMSICARCHNGKQLPDTCSTCHVGGAPLTAVNVPIKVHVTASQCQGCHKQEILCAKCHQGLQMPHPTGWRSAHGAVVLERGRSICVSCHTQKDPTFCIDCHGLPMPHPSAWLSGHGGYSLDHPEKCVKCHGQDSCIRCHGLEMPHPAGWLSTHPSTATSSPGLCTKCHSDSFCVACHGVELPHTQSFIADHPNHVYSSGSICMKCHGNGGTGPDGCWGGQCHTGSTYR
jgi:nitrate/TMAO reductase-like tetraheme cytochrome c subunit